MALSFSEDGDMMIEEQLRERLRKVEALYLGATTAGERDAAQAAAARLKGKLINFYRCLFCSRFWSGGRR